MNAPNNMQTAKLPARFFEILKQEIAVSQEMLSVLKEEKQALIDMEMQTIINLSRKKEHCLKRLQGLDEMIQQVSRTITGAQPHENIRLKDLVGLLPPLEAKKLEAVRVKLSSLREEVLSKNLINKKFAEETKNFLGDAISTITSTVAERPMYGRSKGLNKPSVNQPSLISREV